MGTKGIPTQWNQINQSFFHQRFIDEENEFSASSGVSPDILDYCYQEGTHIITRKLSAWIQSQPMIIFQSGDTNAFSDCVR
jgi:hypothetical protein